MSEGGVELLKYAQACHPHVPAIANQAELGLAYALLVPCAQRCVRSSLRLGFVERSRALGKSSVTCERQPDSALVPPSPPTTTSSSLDSGAAAAGAGEGAGAGAGAAGGIEFADGEHGGSSGSDDDSVGSDTENRPKAEARVPPVSLLTLETLPVMKGNLRKEGHNLWKTWNIRFFVRFFKPASASACSCDVDGIAQVLEQDSVLGYYETEKCRGERKWFKIDHLCHLEADSKHRDFCWRVWGPHGMLKLQAGSQEEYAAWFEALTAHIGFRMYQQSLTTEKEAGKPEAEQK